jgi:hypothetical protein
MAVCIVENGIARGECHDPPSVGTALSRLNWALIVITGNQRAPETAIPESDFQMLTDKRFVRASGAIVTFAIPPSLGEAVLELRFGQQ